MSHDVKRRATNKKAPNTSKNPIVILPRGNDVNLYSNATLKLDRRHMLWFSRYYSKTTSKGTVVGWYLDGPAHEPYWQNRQTKFIRNPRRKTKHISEKVKQKFEQLRLGTISTDFHLTAGELKTLSAIFDRRAEEEPATEQTKPRLNSKEQLDLQNILKNMSNPGYLPTPPKEGKIEELGSQGDDVAATTFAYQEHQRRMDAARDRRLGKMGRRVEKKKEDEFAEMWASRGDEHYLVRTQAR